MPEPSSNSCPDGSIIIIACISTALPDKDRYSNLSNAQPTRTCPAFREQHKSNRRIVILSDKPVDELADYVIKWQNHLTKWFGPRMDVAGKRVLVIGSQYGPELLWALRSGAREVVGLDPEGCSPEALLMALQRLGLEGRSGAFRMMQATTHDVSDIGSFDYVNLAKKRN